VWLFLIGIENTSFFSFFFFENLIRIENLITIKSYIRDCPEILPRHTV